MEWRFKHNLNNIRSRNLFLKPTRSYICWSLWCISAAVDAIRSGIDVLVGTPGRIKDHLQNNKLDLSQLKHVVLDEVDQMLDMGFAEQVEEILSASYKKGGPFSTKGKLNTCQIVEIKIA